MFQIAPGREAVESDEDFETLYARYHRLVRSVLFKLTVRDAVDDLVQETFLKIWRNRDSVRDVEAMTAWICRIAVNVARDAHRSRKRTPPTATLPEDLEAPSRRPDAQQLVLRGLESLSIKHREVIVLYCLEDLTMEEVAESLGVPVGTVKSRIHHGKQALEDFFRRNGGMP